MQQRSGMAGQPKADGKQGEASCATKDLSITLGHQDGAAGTTHQQIEFKNNGQPCYLRGFPGVSLVVDHNGTQLGEPAKREKKDYQEIHLEPGQSATASVGISAAGKYPKEECHPAKADGLRVYPPNETHAVYIPLEVTGCDSEKSILTVSPVA